MTRQRERSEREIIAERLKARVVEIETAELQRASHVEKMGEALAALSAKLQATGWLDTTANHLLYEAVVKAWSDI